MASLVAYGESSGSESETEDNTASDKKEPSEVEAPVNYLTGSIDSSDDEDKDPSEKKEDNTKDKLPNPLSDKKPLPKPHFGKKGKVKKLSLQGSIYENPFETARLAKHSILEQHVKMTANEQEKMDKAGKKICWNYRKGKCRFGNKCKYSHGNDQTPQGLDAAKEKATNKIGLNDNSSHGNDHYSNRSWSDAQDVEEPDDESYMGQSKRKKRHGVNDKLMPSKKAMKDLDRIRAKERPWTLNQ